MTGSMNMDEIKKKLEKEQRSLDKDWLSKPKAKD